MKISLFQQNIEWLDPEANWQKIEQTMSTLCDTDLLVLPEMCTSGFVTNPAYEAVEAAAAVEARLLQLAAKYNMAVTGSFAVSDNGHRHNRMYFATPEGHIEHYDKKHLFRPGMEHMGYEPGEDRVVVSWRGLRFMLCVCYDLRFPVWLRYSEAYEYDVLICVANWPKQRQLAWNVLLRARAIENQAYCIGVNRVGSDDMCEYIGGTQAVHPYGHTVAETAEGEECVCTFEPDEDKLLSYRQKFPCLQDADRF